MVSVSWFLLLAVAVTCATAQAPVCLPHAAVSSNIAVVVHGAQLCSETREDAELVVNMTRSLHRLVARNTSFPERCGLQIFVPHRCRQTGNRRPRTYILFKVTVTCTSKCERHSSDRETGKSLKEKTNRALLYLRTKEKFRMRYRDHRVNVSLFKGRRSREVSCPGAKIDISKTKLDTPFCRCPSECPPPLGRQAACPVLTEAPIGICLEACSHDKNCSEGELCCSNGCGHACMQADSLPHYEWLHKCVEPCSDIVGRLGRTRPGAYRPQCEDDGSFSPVQLWGSTGSSWCVDRESGKPLTGAFPRGQIAACEEDTEPPELLRGTTCPVGQGGGFGICVELCSDDSECDEDQLCCSNGCGHRCGSPDSPPYYQPPDNCRDTCGWLQRALQASTPLPGAYLPQCMEDGRFSPAQEWSSIGQSWCVDTKSGKPTTGFFPRGQDPDCVD